MNQWQGTGKRRLLEAFLKSCSSNYTRTKQSILNPNQEVTFHKRLQPNSSFFVPRCSYMFQASLGREGVMFSQHKVLCVLQQVHREAVCTWAWSLNFQHLGVFGLQWLQNAFKPAKWLSCLVEVKPTGSKLFGCFLYFEKIFSGDRFLYREMGGFFRLSAKPFQNS